jgi:hypothetical protein
VCLVEEAVGGEGAGQGGGLAEEAASVGVNHTEHSRPVPKTESTGNFATALQIGIPGFKALVGDPLTALQIDPEWSLLV